MTCEQAMELLSPMLDGELDPQLSEALEAHLEACPDCKALADSLRGLDVQLAGLKEPAPESLKRGVLYKIDQATGKAKKPRSRWFGPGTVIGAVAAVLVLLVGVGVIPLNSRSTAQSPNFAAEDYAFPETEAPTDTLRLGRPDLNEDGISYLPNGLTGESVTGAIQNTLQGDHWDSADETEDPIIIAPHTTPSQPDYEQPSDKRGEESVPPAEPEPVSDELRTACMELSAAENAAVLLYTEFDCKSLFLLLETEQPELYALVETLEPEEYGELFVFKTDCGTALAIHEWLLAHLPESTSRDEALQAAETRMRVRMEELDPGSGFLYRIVSWTASDHDVVWPDAWPADWADRFRTAENWALFFPSERYTPNAEKPAYLLFVP